MTRPRSSDISRSNDDDRAARLLCQLMTDGPSSSPSAPSPRDPTTSNARPRRAPGNASQSTLLCDRFLQLLTCSCWRAAPGRPRHGPSLQYVCVGAKAAPMYPDADGSHAHTIRSTTPRSAPRQLRSGRALGPRDHRLRPRPVEGRLPAHSSDAQARPKSPHGRCALRDGTASAAATSRPAPAITTKVTV